MCLWILKGAKPNVAQKAFKVYKVLTSDNDAPYRPEYTYHHGLNLPVKEPPKQHADEFSMVSLGSGYLFAFVCREAAENNIKTFEFKSPGMKFKIVEMEVPAGTEYFGESSDVIGMGEIAARALEWKQ